MKQPRIPRRLFLRAAAGASASAVVGLPLLESLGLGELPFLEALGPSRAKAQAAPFKYALFMRQGNGVLQQQFWPKTAGALTVASLQADASEDRTVGILADYAPKLTMVHGLKYNYSTTGCGHADGCLQALTSSAPDGNNSNESLATGPSIDWVISQQLDPMGTEPVSLYAGVTSSYLGDVILYRGSKQRRAGERNPMNAYNRLFGMQTSPMEPGAADPDAARIALRRKSVNDIVRAQMMAVLGRPELSGADKKRLDAHFSAIRDLEVQVSSGCQVTPLDPFDSSKVDEVVRAHSDLLALAMSCGKSHVGSLCIGNGNDQTQYTIDGKVYERFHHISHRVRSDGSSGEEIPNAEELHHNIDKKFAGYFKYLLDKLSAITTPTGTLLDDGVAVWMNDLADGPAHSSRNLPWVLAGGAGGALKTGQYVRGDWTINRIHNTIGAAVGAKNAAGGPLDDFGDDRYPKGHIDGLLA
jgi:hypothetical protein